MIRKKTLPSYAGAASTGEDGVISKLKKMKPHAPGIVIFADHNRLMPWSVTYHAAVMFADISGNTNMYINFHLINPLLFSIFLII